MWGNYSAALASRRAPVQHQTFVIPSTCCIVNYLTSLILYGICNTVLEIVWYMTLGVYLSSPLVFFARLYHPVFPPLGGFRSPGHAMQLVFCCNLFLPSSDLGRCKEGRHMWHRQIISEFPCVDRRSLAISGMRSSKKFVGPMESTVIFCERSNSDKDLPQPVCCNGYVSPHSPSWIG